MTEHCLKVCRCAILCVAMIGLRASPLAAQLAYVPVHQPNGVRVVDIAAKFRSSERHRRLGTGRCGDHAQWTICLCSQRAVEFGLGDCREHEHGRRLDPVGRNPRVLR